MSPDVTALDQSGWATAKARAARTEGGAVSLGWSAFGTTSCFASWRNGTGYEKVTTAGVRRCQSLAVPPEEESGFEQLICLAERRTLQ